MVAAAVWCFATTLPTPKAATILGVPLATYVSGCETAWELRPASFSLLTTFITHAERIHGVPSFVKLFREVGYRLHLIALSALLHDRLPKEADDPFSAVL
jgi:hypothetical protein